MATYTAPTTRTTGALISASIWNTDIVENLKYFKDAPTFDGAVKVTGALTPNTNDGSALGSATVSWADLFLASGGVVNFNNGDVTVTHSTNTLTFAGAASGYIFNDGNVGIGTSSPSGLLHVSYNANSTGWQYLQQVNTGASAAAALNVLNTGGGDLRVTVNSANNTSGVGASGVTIFQHANAAMGFGTNATERLRITSGGDLLVGGTSNSLNARLLAENASGNQVGIRYSGIATYYLNATSGGDFAINKDGSERARITTGGELLVGQTATGLQNSNSFAAGPTAAGFVANHANGVDPGTTYGVFGYNAGTIGSITQNGYTGVAYNTSSDYRLKDNPQPLTGSGTFIDALEPKTWDWKSDGSRGVGFIAHEVEAVSPTSVTGQKDAVDAEGNPVMQQMAYGSPEFIANIIAELKSLRARVAALEA